MFEPTASLFKNLQLSIVQLLGGTIGGGFSVPITQNYWHWFLNAQHDVVEALGLGIYTLLLSVVGTWLFLGLFGRAARVVGGRPLQFVVQISGIIIAAWLCLPVAILITLIAMLLVGQEVEDQKKIDENKK